MGIYSIVDMGSYIVDNYELLVANHSLLKLISTTGTPELGDQEGQLPPLPFAGRGKEGKSAL